MTRFDEKFTGSRITVAGEWIIIFVQNGTCNHLRQILVARKLRSCKIMTVDLDNMLERAKRNSPESKKCQVAGNIR